MSHAIPPESILHQSLTPKELARRWRCRVTVVRAMIRDGRLHAIQISTRSQLRWVARLSVLATRDMPRKRRNTFGAAPFVRLLSETRNCKSASAC